MRRQFNKAKQFVKDHPTATACVVTAAVSWKLSHAATMKGVLGTTTAMSYEWGRRNGVLTLQNNIMLDFVNSKELGDELLAFVATVGDVSMEEAT